ILDQLNRERIVLNPSFQRRAAWKEDRRSAFIESILLDFPIPQIVLAEVKGEPHSKVKYIVLDGKQRLLSLVHFAGDFESLGLDAPLSLKGLGILTSIENLNWADLKNISSPDWAGEFENRTIRTIMLRGWKNEDLLYHVFLRLNT